jgi:hypothetical protein
MQSSKTVSLHLFLTFFCSLSSCETVSLRLPKL